MPGITVCDVLYMCRGMRMCARAHTNTHTHNSLVDAKKIIFCVLNHSLLCVNNNFDV